MFFNRIKTSRLLETPAKKNVKMFPRTSGVKSFGLIEPLRRALELTLTLFSPSMTMTGTAVAGQRCFAGRGLSQFHKTRI